MGGEFEMGDRQNIGKDTAWGKGAIKLWSVSILLLLGAAVLAYFWWFDRVKAGELPETKHLAAMRLSMMRSSASGIF